ncbi:MAG: aminopeptidase P family protein, partial [Candidatus Aminicenantes bacterium]|nr:aminopeptidase P family protein [Candidatus Aminicenantes bacterium]
MFDAKTYSERRRTLLRQIRSGLVVLFGNDESPMNYIANTYPFRQDSTFLYFFGLATPGLAAVIDAEEGTETLYGDDFGLEDIIWMGYLPTLQQRALAVGIKATAPLAKFEETVRKAVKAGRKLHVLPAYRADAARAVERLLGLAPGEAKAKASLELIKAVVEQRIIKSPAEIDEIEAALGVTSEMYQFAMKTAKPGRYERDVAGGMEGIALVRGFRPAFPLIVTVNGQILHNHDHGNLMKKGQLLVVDAGAESPRGYAADITRTIPVGGRFNARQKDVYEIVLAGQETAIKMMKPGLKYRDVHLKVASVMASGLKELGLMKGDLKDAVAKGAHAMFFPHGLGHHLGLDVHDMENLGENHVGYSDTVKRSDQFGLAYLRMGKELKPGHVLTVEPGLYFIPALVAKWKKEKKF